MPVHHLLVTETPSHQSYVMRYESCEMEELFTPEQRDHLKEGRVVRVKARHGYIVYVDMLVAAQKRLENDEGWIFT